MTAVISRAPWTYDFNNIPPSVPLGERDTVAEAKAEAERIAMDEGLTGLTWHEFITGSWDLRSNGRDADIHVYDHDANL